MAVFQNYPVHLPLVHIAMTPPCAEGLRLEAEWEKKHNAYQKFGRIHMLMFLLDAMQKYEEHLDGCEVCKEDK